MEQAKLLEIVERARQLEGQEMNEAATKNALILPFIQGLGYDIFNPMEVAAEYTADVGTKKNEKIDFAIIRDGLPVVLIECKPLGAALDAGKCSQLYRYFNTQPSAKIGVLTNGTQYMFFTDLEQTNIMDGKPFMQFDLLSFNERLLPELKKITKESWDLDGAISAASRLKYIHEVKKLLDAEAQSPSEEFVRFFASRVYDRPLTAKVRERFQTVVRRAIQEYIGEQINARLESAKVASNNHPEEPAAAQEQELPAIVTTEEEIRAFIIVQAILRDVVSPKRVAMRDAKSYCAILLDDNNRKPLCRLHLGGKSWSLGLFDEQKNESRVKIESLEDIYLHADALKQTVGYYEAP